MTRPVLSIQARDAFQLDLLVTVGNSIVGRRIKKPCLNLPGKTQ